jgi:GNAT superfamily N-acetyltransferase
VRSPGVVTELDPPGFLARLDEVVAIYAAAMRPDPADLPGRRYIMQRHAANPNFRALAVSEWPGGPLTAFSYAFRGQAGQWWHDVVLAGITTAAGSQAASGWLSSAMEIAEVHVHPDYQRRGTGRRMLLTLTAGRSERTALLSTRDAESPARRLYRDLGFSDLLTGYSFPGGSPPYAVMGAVLPLRGGPAAGDGGPPG